MYVFCIVECNCGVNGFWLKSVCNGSSFDYFIKPKCQAGKFVEEMTD